MTAKKPARASQPANHQLYVQAAVDEAALEAMKAIAATGDRSLAQVSGDYLSLGLAEEARVKVHDADVLRHSIARTEMQHTFRMAAANNEALRAIYHMTTVNNIMLSELAQGRTIEAKHLPAITEKATAATAKTFDEQIDPQALALTLEAFAEGDDIELQLEAYESQSPLMAMAGAADEAEQGA